MVATFQAKHKNPYNRGMIKIGLLLMLSIASSIAAGVPALTLTIHLDDVTQLRTVIGFPNLHLNLTIGIKDTSTHSYYWDENNRSPDNGASVLQPDNFVGVGRWRKTELSNNEPHESAFNNFQNPSFCQNNNVLQNQINPSNSPEEVKKMLITAINSSAATGCPIYVKAGLYSFNQDIMIANNGITIFCERGAIFKKLGTSNGFRFTGAFNKMLGQCEIDGNNQQGSGLIIESSAKNTLISGVFAHHNGGHGILNSGQHTEALNIQTDDNKEVGFANDRAKGLVIKSLLSRNNGNEGLTIDNFGTNEIQVFGGYIEGNCQRSGVGNIGIDAATDVTITGIIANNPSPQCPWNLTVQNNVGNTNQLNIYGGYFSGANLGDIHFRTNDIDGFTVKNSSINGILSSSGSYAVILDHGTVNNSVNINQGNRVKFQ